jgi:DNA-binding NarL/FixJ family response regulator
MTSAPARPARILIADDHDVVRRGLRALLESAGHKVCAEASTGREALAAARRTAPDVAVLDVSMPDMNGLEAAARIREAVPDAEVLVLTAHDAEEVVRGALEAGARGYVLKSDAGCDLVDAVADLLCHRPHFTTRVAEMVLEGYLGASTVPQAMARGGGAPAAKRLTPRERETLQLLAEGRTTKQIALALEISVKTVETHRSNLMRSLGLDSISDLVRYAVRNRIIEA